jgi:histone H3
MARTKALAKKMLVENNTTIKKPATSNPTIDNDSNTKKTKRRWKSGTVAKREIRNLQKTTHSLIPKAAITRLIRETTQKISMEKGLPDMRLTSDAVSALIQASETSIIELMQVATVLRAHAKRDTLAQSDISLANIIVNTIYTPSSE